MATEKKGATNAQDPASANAPAVTQNNNIFEERMKMQVNVNPDQVSGVFRGAKLLAAKKGDFDKLTIGIPNSAIRKGEIFKVLKPGIIEQVIQGEKRTLPILFIENLKGEQRPIYASGLLRGTPTRTTEQNEYSQDVIDFDRGILQKTVGMAFPQSFEKLVGNGEDFIHCTETIAYQTVGYRLDEKGQQNTDEANKFTANQTAYRLEFVSREDAEAMSTED